MKRRSGAQGEPSTPSGDEIRSQLAAILAASPFVNANRSRRFLEFTVQQTLAGAHDAIKEIVIADEVFDRNAGFDPRMDPIVRVEAGKLRVRLQEYYKGEGKLAPVLIEIPKGSYVPRFSQRTPADIPVSSTRLAQNVKIVAIAAVAVLAVTAGLWFFRTRPSRAGEIPSIAVLPFMNLSPEPQSEYFSDGLAEQLTDVLTRVEGLRVASRTSAFTFKGKPVEAAEIGMRLKVSAFLEGSVQKAGDRVRITVQLIQTSDGYHLWSRTFDRELRDIFRLQDEITAAVVRALKLTLADNARRELFRRYTLDLDAFDLFLRGRQALMGLEPNGPEQAIVLFRRAIDRDPKFALAYAGIAAATGQYNYAANIPASAIQEQMKTAATKALELDNRLAEAQGMLANIEADNWNWSAAEQKYRQAIALNARSAEVHFSYSQMLLSVRRFDEALAECKVAQDLDPLSQQVAYCKPWIQIYQGNAEAALAEFQRLLAEQPANPAFAFGAVHAALHAGREKEALAMLERATPDIRQAIRSTPVLVASLGYAYGRTGHTAKALEIEHLLKEASATTYVSPGVLCIVHLGLGQLDEARKDAARDIQRGNANARYLALDPIFAPLRADPKFAELLKPMGIPF